MKAEIELTPQQWKRLNELARERSITLSQLLEAIVNQALTKNALEDWEELKRRALSVVGQFRS
jgi:post-segregation antitoxin (ccd killing protein)